MRLNDSIEELETMWADEDGFLFQLRMGHFEHTKAQQFIARIGEIEPGDAEAVPRRAVSLLWYLPLFMTWQSERVDAKYRAELEQVITTVTNHLEGLLGVP